MIIKKLFTVLCLVAVAGFAVAQPVPSTAPVPRVVFPATVVGNSINLGVSTANAANAANFSFGAASNGSVFANGPMSVPTAGGASVLVDVGGRIPKTSVIRALGSFLGKVLPILNTGVALYDLGKELGMNLSTDASGGFTGSRPTSDVQCDMSKAQQSYTDPVTWCAGVQGGAQYGVGALPYQEAGSCKLGAHCASGYYGGFHTVPLVTGGHEEPVSRQQFLDAVAAKSGWPPESALARVVADAIKSGEALDVVPETVTGPSSSTGPKSVVQSPSNNTTTTNQTINNYAYDGAKITITNTSSSSVVNNSTGAVTPGDTVIKDAVLPEPKTVPQDIKVCGLTGDTACKIDETGMPLQSDIDAKMAPDAATKIQKDINDIAADPVSHLPKMPSINWAFVLPSGCATIPTPAFEPMLKGIDVCQFQPVFHDLMSIVWVFGGLFGAISLFMKSSLAD